MTTAAVSFSENEEKVLPRLNELLMKEMRMLDMYNSYQYLLKGVGRVELVDEFREHAEQELEHAQILQRYIVAMGQRPTLDRYPVPDIRGGIEDYLKKFHQLEVEGVQSYQRVIKELDDDTSPLYQELQGILMTEAEHVHDFELWMDLNEVQNIEPQTKEPEDLEKEEEDDEDIQQEVEDALEEEKTFKLG